MCIDDDEDGHVHVKSKHRGARKRQRNLETRLAEAIGKVQTQGVSNWMLRPKP